MRGAPQSQFSDAHSSDQRPQAGIKLWPASRIPRFPAPITAHAGTVPAHDGFRPDDHHGLEDRWKPAIELDEEQAIAVSELDPATHLALQHDQLMPKRGILCFK
jgi:hypothetical protein